MTLLSALAREAEIPVFAAIGAQGLALAETLCDTPGIRLVSTPRHARVLLVAGEVDSCHLRSLERLHAQLPAPRGTVWWQASPLFSYGQSVSDNDPFAALRQAAQASEPDQRPDLPPQPWQGIGPHGQGGEGMMGGSPYGRPMATTADDIRDGLVLLFPEQDMLRPLIAALSVATMTLGNLAALWQDDVRRLIGWSSVSQSGYALMAAAVAGLAPLALPSLIWFLAAYALANLTALP